MENYLVKLVLSIVVLIPAVYTDVKYGKIRNKHLLLCLALGCLAVVADPLNAVQGLMLPLVLFPFFALEVYGAGDIKLLCVLGFIGGWRMSMNITVFSVAITGLMLLALIVVKQKDFSLWKDAKSLFRKMGFWLLKIDSIHMASSSGASIPMAVAILYATLLVYSYYFICKTMPI